MRFLIASDLHGSAPCCRRLFEVFEAERADRLILLGDLLYHGPRNDLPEGYAPRETAALLNSHKDRLFCVRGNCDAEVDQMVLNFPIMSDSALMPCGDRTIFITHGHRFNVQNRPPLCRGDVLLHGHTHVPAWAAFGEDNLYLNPGSLALPKESTPKSYMVFEKGLFLWKKLDNEEVYHSLNLC